MFVLLTTTSHLEDIWTLDLQTRVQKNVLGARQMFMYEKHMWSLYIETKLFDCYVFLMGLFGYPISAGKWYWLTTIH